MATTRTPERKLDDPTGPRKLDDPTGPTTIELAAIEAAAVRTPRLRRHDPALGRYFQDLSVHGVLSVEEETAAATEISRLEIRRWATMLGEPALCETVVEAIRAAAGPELALPALTRIIAAARRTAKVRDAAGRRKGLARYKLVAGAIADEIYNADPKRELSQTVHDRVLELTELGPRPPRYLAAYLAELCAVDRELERAKHLFIQANLRLVVAIARRYDRGQMPLIDLIQEGNLGLIKAVDRFDHRRGFRFSTYASWWIRHAIGRALADKGHAVRVPVHALDTHHRLEKASDAIGKRLGRAPTDDELAAEVGIDGRKLARARRHTVVPVCSLDREISWSDDRRYVDILADEDAPSPFDDTMLEIWRRSLDGVLEVLSPIEESIIRWRYGLDDGDELTLKEIGERYNLSRERIRQLQEQALRKIREKLAVDAA